jgi:L-rhamnose mutarotase
MHCRALSLSGVALLLAIPAAGQQASRPYTEGGVTDVQYIRVKPGHFDEYMAFLAGPYKQLMDAQKKAGVITGWSIYQSDNRDEQDWNIVLTTSYKNMAALDNLPDRVDPITKQVYGSLEKSSDAMVKRSEMRDIVGNRLLRELTVK